MRHQQTIKPAPSPNDQPASRVTEDTELLRRLHFLASRITHDNQLAEDAVQEACIKAVTANLDSVEKIDSWLRKVVIREALMIKRKMKRRQTGELEMRTLVDEPKEDEFEQWENRKLVRDAVSTLPDDLRIAVHLHYFEGMGTAETAETLGISQRAVNKRLSKAKDVLEHRLSDQKIQYGAVGLVATLQQALNEEFDHHHTPSSLGELTLPTSESAPSTVTTGPVTSISTAAIVKLSTLVVVTVAALVYASSNEWNDRSEISIEDRNKANLTNPFSNKVAVADDSTEDPEIKAVEDEPDTEEGVAENEGSSGFDWTGGSSRILNITPTIYIKPYVPEVDLKDITSIECRARRSVETYNSKAIRNGFSANADKATKQKDGWFEMQIRCPHVTIFELTVTIKGDLQVRSFILVDPESEEHNYQVDFDEEMSLDGYMERHLDTFSKWSSLKAPTGATSNIAYQCYIEEDGKYYGKALMSGHPVTFVPSGIRKVLLKAGDEIYFEEIDFEPGRVTTFELGEPVEMVDIQATLQIDGQPAAGARVEIYANDFRDENMYPIKMFALKTDNQGVLNARVPAIFANLDVSARHLGKSYVLLTNISVHKFPTIMNLKSKPQEKK